jgi:cytochrome oxidase Cu insertion factor (SCO1/SenC/PrrC family)
LAATLASVTALVLALVFLFRGQSGQEPGTVDASLVVGDVAPGFSVPGVDDQPVSLADFRGQNVLLYFSMGHG